MLGMERALWRGQEAGEVTAGPRLSFLQVHCGQLSDSEEWSLQAVEKHVSGARAPVRWGLLKTLITSCGKMIWPGSWTDLGSSPPSLSYVTLSKTLNLSEPQCHI